MTKVVTFRYFGIDEERYLRGLFTEFPIFLNLALSWISLVAAKFAYFVGLRPSDAGIEIGWLTVRAGAGFLLLPGLIYSAFFARRRERLFIWLFILPIFLGPTQDRYNLAIQPLLFFYGAVTFTQIWSRWKGQPAAVEVAPLQENTKR